MDSRTLVTQMQQLGLWPQNPASQQVITGLCDKFAADVRAFTRELLQRDFLSAYQANLLLTGKGRQLVVGPYVVSERLGEGGMGQVFKARHRHINRTVALKVIRPDKVTSTTAVNRFLREVQIAAQMNDPNIVRAYDADTADGNYYFAMEYMHGTDLSVYVRSRGPLPIDQACQLLYQASLGLQHIHELGMIHRDIKPGNLMLSLEGTPTTLGPAGIAVRTAPATLKILDLGLARLMEDENGEHGSRLGITHEGTVIGTADYMAPEQARNSREADIRSDIYALGCSFYFALAGQVPFPGGTAVDKIMRHQIDEPPSLDRFRPHLPMLLASIIKKMMAKSPAERYQSPAEVAVALKPLLAPDDSTPPLAIPVFQAEQHTLSDNLGATREDRRKTAERQRPRRQVSLWLVAAVAAGSAIVFFSLAAVFAILIRALLN